jgi:hypothetical protein
LTTVPEPATPNPPLLPVQIRVIEDLRRSRLTVFFRLLLALPHLVWMAIWTTGVVLLAFVAWLVVLFKAEMPAGMHRFFVMYLRYVTHVYAYLNLAANPFPGFLGENGYEVDIEVDPPVRQGRVKAGFRLFLAIPALLLSGVIGGGVEGGASYGIQVTGILSACGFLTWFYALATGRASEGISRLQWYCLHYAAQTYAYVLLLTERYPTTDPERVGVPWPAPDHPVRLEAQPDDGRRSRLTVFFRLPLAFPHFFWMLLWGVLAILVALVNWVVTLVRGRSSDPLHRFLAAFIRYQTHVYAFLSLAAAPFPGFSGLQASYPVDIRIAPPERQNRWRTGFRIFLAIPAMILNSGIGGALWIGAFLGWFAALVTGRMPDGLRKLELFALRYSAQLSAYGYLLTERYPYAGPPA